MGYSLMIAPFDFANHNKIAAQQFFDNYAFFELTPKRAKEYFLWFKNEKAVNDFFRIILSYGPDYRPVKYGRSEPVKELFDEKHLEKVTTAWLGGNDCTCEVLESLYCMSQLIQTTIAKNFLKKDKQEMDKYVSLCNDLVCRFSPVLS